METGITCLYPNKHNYKGTEGDWKIVIRGLHTILALDSGIPGGIS